MTKNSKNSHSHLDSQEEQVKNIYKKTGSSQIPFNKKNRTFK